MTGVESISPVTTHTVAYPADGLTMIGPEGPRLNDFQRRRTDALAELGYVTPAFDLRGGRWSPIHRRCWRA